LPKNLKNGYPLEYINQITKNMQVLFLAILVLAIYLVYTKISKKTTKQGIAPEKIEPIVEAKVEEFSAPVELAPVKAAKKPAAKKPAVKKPAAKKPAKAETTKVKKAKK
jgi:hypothetical protein